MPSLFVFDLDLTLWHCGSVLWCDQLKTPLHKTADNRVQDAGGSRVSLFHDVPQILTGLSTQDITLALASRTSAPAIARQLLSFFQISHHFPFQEIYPGAKTTHFAALHEQTGIPYHEMVFFDDEQRNISDVAALGVESHLVSHGMTMELLQKICL